MNNKILPAVVLAVCSAPLFAQSPVSLKSSFDQALSGFKAENFSRAESIKGVPVVAPAAVNQDKNRYAHFANIWVQSNELVSRQGNKAVLKFKASLTVRRFQDGHIIADEAKTEFLNEVTLSEKGNVSYPYILPQILGVKLYLKGKQIAVADFINGSIPVSGKVTDKKVRVTGTGRVWGWVDFELPKPQ